MSSFMSHMCTWLHMIVHLVGNLHSVIEIEVLASTQQSATSLDISRENDKMFC